MENNTFKCHFCAVCNGQKCISELPGMGGVYENKNFQNNYDAWRSERIRQLAVKAGKDKDPLFPRLRLAPMTGGVENVGYQDETQFYRDMIKAAFDAGFALSIGDGTPDIKLQAGIAAVEDLRHTHPYIRAAVFIKPYPNKQIAERIRWAEGIAEYIGIDIDSYNIATMRNLVNLERKSAADLKELKNISKEPFMVKGVFTQHDIDIMKEVLPDIIVVSNHGGRVENGTGSTADYLAAHYKELRSYCAQLWVDGGLRTAQDIETASFFGVQQVMIGRPIAAALCRGGAAAVKDLYQTLTENR